MEELIVGSWGYEALDSDEGLDVVDFLEDHIPKDCNFKLSEIISSMKGNLLDTDFNEPDFVYDNSAMALAELYFMFKDTGKLRYENEDDETKSLTNIRGFSADKNSLEYLLGLLENIKNGISDEENIREIVELWKDSKEGYWGKWETHLNKLIERVNAEIRYFE
jgi:hypothetical protein